MIDDGAELVRDLVDHHIEKVMRVVLRESVIDPMARAIARLNDEPPFDPRPQIGTKPRDWEQRKAQKPRRKNRR